jgi:hypothetical protein
MSFQRVPVPVFILEPPAALFTLHRQVILNDTVLTNSELTCLFNEYLSLSLLPHCSHSTVKWSSMTRYLPLAANDREFSLGHHLQEKTRITAVKFKMKI